VEQTNHPRDKIRINILYNIPRSIGPLEIEQGKFPDKYLHARVIRVPTLLLLLYHILRHPGAFKRFNLRLTAWWAKIWAWYNITGLFLADVVHSMDFRVHAAARLRMGKITILLWSIYLTGSH
jgi:hypothetical protein